MNHEMNNRNVRSIKIELTRVRIQLAYIICYHINKFSTFQVHNEKRRKHMMC